MQIINNRIVVKCFGGWVRWRNVTMRVASSGPKQTDFLHYISSKKIFYGTGFQVIGASRLVKRTVPCNSIFFFVFYSIFEILLLLMWLISISLNNISMQILRSETSRVEFIKSLPKIWKTRLNDLEFRKTVCSVLVKRSCSNMCLIQNRYLIWGKFFCLTIGTADFSPQSFLYFIHCNLNLATLLLVAFVCWYVHDKCSDFSNWQAFCQSLIGKIAS